MASTKVFRPDTERAKGAEKRTAAKATRDALDHLKVDGMPEAPAAEFAGTHLAAACRVRWPCWRRIMECGRCPTGAMLSITVAGMATVAALRTDCAVGGAAKSLPILLD